MTNYPVAMNIKNTGLFNEEPSFTAYHSPQFSEQGLAIGGVFSKVELPPESVVDPP